MLTVETVGAASRGAGNNGPVSTAMASSFLNGPGARCGTGRSSARPERAIGVAGPLADLAALVPRGLPGIPGPLQLGCTMGTVPYFSAISPLSPHRLGQAGHHPADRRRPGCRKQAGKQTETGRKRNGNRPGGDRCPLIENSLIDGSPARRPAHITAQPGHHYPSQIAQSRRVTA